MVLAATLLGLIQKPDIDLKKIWGVTPEAVVKTLGEPSRRVSGTSNRFTRYQEAVETKGFVYEKVGNLGPVCFGFYRLPAGKKIELKWALIGLGTGTGAVDALRSLGLNPLDEGKPAGPLPIPLVGDVMVDRIWPQTYWTPAISEKKFGWETAQLPSKPYTIIRFGKVRRAIAGSQFKVGDTIIELHENNFPRIGLTQLFLGAER